MNKIKIKIAGLAGLLMILNACGSGKPVIPEINDDNCQESVYLSLEASVARKEITLEEFQDFFGGCSTRPSPNFITGTTADDEPLSMHDLILDWDV